MTEKMTFAECAAEARVDPATVWRWAKKGYKGVRLCSTRIGHHFVVNRNAWSTFKLKTGQV